VVLISLSIHTRKDFQVIIAFDHSAFVTLQSLFVPMKCYWKDIYLVEHSANVSHIATRAVCPHAHSLHKIYVTSNCTTEAVEHCQDGGVIIILAK